MYHYYNDVWEASSFFQHTGTTCSNQNIMITISSIPQSKKVKKRERSGKEDELEPPVKKIHIRVADLPRYCFTRNGLALTFDSTFASRA